MIQDAQIHHLIDLCEQNMIYHREMFRETGDQHNRGQWKAYTRLARCLNHLEGLTPKRRNGKPELCV